MTSWLLGPLVISLILISLPIIMKTAAVKSVYNNSPGFVDERIDELLVLGRSTVDPEQRKAYYEELQERALELSPLVYLMWRDQSYAASVDVQGFEPLPGFLSFQSGYMLEEIYK